MTRRDGFVPSQWETEDDMMEDFLNLQPDYFDRKMYEKFVKNNDCKTAIKLMKESYAKENGNGEVLSEKEAQHQDSEKDTCDSEKSIIPKTDKKIAAVWSCSQTRHLKKRISPQYIPAGMNLR